MARRYGGRQVRREKKAKGKRKETAQCKKLRNIIGLSYGRGCVVLV